jgi:two-component system, LytTR family, sensor kinase
MISMTVSRILRILAAVAALWAGVALLFASESYLSGLYRGRPIDFVSTLGYSLAYYGVWALVTPVVILMAQRWPIAAGDRLNHLSRHGAASVGIALLQAGLFAILFWPIYGPINHHDTRLDLWAGMIVANFPSNMLIYTVLVGGVMALAARTAARDREAAAARLRARLAQAELEALRAQIHPHFLFNALHGISALVREDPPAAERLIAKLGTLLRSALNSQRQEMIPLRGEMDFLKDYLEVEGMRFGERLSSRIKIADCVGGALVPPLLLQPLVENAIRHGFPPVPGTMTVEVLGYLDNNHLALTVRDDGKGADSAEPREGIGLGNLRARLEQTFGSKQSMRIETGVGKGFKVILQLPLCGAEQEYVG